MNPDYGHIGFLWGTIHQMCRRLRPDGLFCRPGASSYLQKALAAKMCRVFEWSSGCSTIWFASRAYEVVAIEHDLGWVEWVAHRLAALDGVRAECRYVPVLTDEQLRDFCWRADWKYYEVLGRAPARPQFRDYIAAIDGFEDQYFDVIAIDGRKRLGCLLHGVSKLKAGGVVLLDDSNRPRYSQCSELLSEWT